jgi:hypothetical protein
MDPIELAPEQEQEALVIADILMTAMRVEAVHMGWSLASKGNRDLFGQTEFQLRDILLKLGT